MNRFVALSLTAASVLAVQNVNASPVGSYVQNNNGGVQPVLNNDLVNQGQSTLLSTSAANYTAYQDASPNVLNDGSGGGFNTVPGDTAVTTQTGPWTLTYQLNTASAPNGYDISKIDVLSLWTDDFVNQNYNIAFATTTNSSFVSIGSFTRPRPTTRPAARRFNRLLSIPPACSRATSSGSNSPSQRSPIPATTSTMPLIRKSM